MKKNKALSLWLWKWHMIAGLITLPVILLLCITGSIYLFKNDVNDFIYQQTLYVQPTQATTEQPLTRLSYVEQMAAVQTFSDKGVKKLILPNNEHQASAFVLRGKGHAANTVYVNPYSGEVTGLIEQKETLMFTIRKLHGELLLSKVGTLTVELVASWFIVLLLTGIYIWWPAKKVGLKGFVTIRRKQGRRTFWRDLHSVMGFWLSIFMLVILAGGMPWTDVFGAQLKWVQKQTDSGFPQHWRSAKGLNSQVNGQQLNVDKMVDIALNQSLNGTISIEFPKNGQGVFSVSNRALWLQDQQVIHFDQYSGKVIKSHDWNDVGLLMDMRLVAMKLHQGQYGAVSHWGVLLVALLFTLSTIAGLVAYLYRKPKGGWGVIRVPASFKATKGLMVLIVGLGVLFPMFGISVVALLVWENVRHLGQSNKPIYEY